MKLIVGLGNPEGKYSNTRHNMGFDVVNKLSEKYDISIKENKFKSLFGKGIIENEKVLILKPQTFMNLSGEAIQECMDFYKLDLQDLIVIYDDMDVKPSNIRIRKKGTAGSHNGMKSIVNILNTTEFTRIRVGIGKPEFKHDMIGYVIGKLDDDENEKLQQGVDLAVDAVSEMIKNGVDVAMNKYNCKRQEGEEN